jgi:O-antigen/teichoic acid export membrane protein
MAGWIDQAVVSVTNLMMLLALGRWSDISDVGYFAIAASVLAVAIAVQDSLVTRPYTILLAKPDNAVEEHTASAAVFSAAVAVGLSAVALLVGSLMNYFVITEAAVSLTFALSAAIPAVLFREFARRHSFAHHRAWRAVAVDVAVAFIAGAGIVCLWFYQELSATNAVLILALSSFAAFSVWFVLMRQNFSISLEALFERLKESFKLGKWFLVGQFSAQAQGYATHWITMAIGGVAATGLYTSCLSLVALSNPFLFGYFNILTPKFVRVLNEEGADALRRQVMLSVTLLAIVMGAFACFVSLNGSMLLGLMFPGEVYRQGLPILTALALATLVGAIGGPPGVALMVMKKGDALALLSFSTLLAGSALVYVLMAAWGLQVAVYGILAMETVGCLGRWILLYRLLSRGQPASSSPPTAASAMRQQ